MGALCKLPTQQAIPLYSESGIPKIPLKEGGEYEIPQQLLAELISAYPEVDVLRQIGKMRAWALANPPRRKSRRGMARFINGWINRNKDHERHQNRTGKVENALRATFGGHYVERSTDPDDYFL